MSARSWRWSAASNAGKVRANNEDRWGVDEALQLFLVADGMGGHAAGEVAAQIVVETLPRALREQVAAHPEAQSADVLHGALVKTSQAVTEEARQTDLVGMGATVVVFWVNQGAALVGHLGDSRAYLWGQEQIELLTRDHSLVELLVESGDITPQEAQTHPMRHQITRFCGMSGEALPEVRSVELPIGARILLCCDGVTNELSDDELKQLCAGEYQESANRIVASAVEAGGRDNATALIIDSILRE